MTEQHPRLPCVGEALLVPTLQWNRLAPAEGEAMVFLNIPMDAETPSLRLLRPQVRRACSVRLAPLPVPAEKLVGID